MMRTLLLATVLVAACAPSATGDPQANAASGAVATSSDPSPSALAGGSLRLTLRLSPGGPEILSRVVSDAPVQRRDPYRNEPTFFRVYDANGWVLAARGFKLETELRCAVPATDGTLSGAHVTIEAPVVSIQVPLFAETAVIRLYRSGGPAPVLLAEVRP